MIQGPALQPFFLPIQLLSISGSALHPERHSTSADLSVFKNHVLDLTKCKKATPQFLAHHILLVRIIYNCGAVQERFCRDYSASNLFHSKPE